MTLSIGQRNQLAEVARTAADDVASYRTPGGTMTTWDEARVGRMLARDAAIAELLPVALVEVERLENRQQELVAEIRTLRAESAQRQRDRDAHAAVATDLAELLTEALAERNALSDQLDEAHLAYAALRAELARTAADRDAATRILDGLRAATSEVLLDADPESEPMLRLAQALQSALRFRSAAPAGERP